MELNSEQLKAVDKLKSGSILCADVGTGKSRTALAYYWLKVVEGTVDINGEGAYSEPKFPCDLYVITTAKKRDSLDWYAEAIPLLLGRDSENNPCKIKMIVDSWNRIACYTKIQNAFFIFDEQRVSGSGPWVKAFIEIARKNRWILLSATPGDKWIDYAPVFIANGFYRNITEFQRMHCIYKPYLPYREISGYMYEKELRQHLSDILVRMRNKKIAINTHLKILCDYDRSQYKMILRRRWNPFEDEPIEDTVSLFYLLRRVVNSDPSRLVELRRVFELRRKLIVFYNFIYEKELIKDEFQNEEVNEWNGQCHDDLPEGDSWLYLVQYNAGAEGWNCITTDTLVFYSQNYSYRLMTQAAGRIDRLSTLYPELFYYHLLSSSSIDVAISKALHEKQDFNERNFSL